MPAVETKNDGVAPVPAELVSAAAVRGERLDGARVQRNLSGLAELGLSDPQHAAGQVDVVAVQAQRLADAQPGHRQQPDQGLEGGRPQRRAELAGRGHQRGDVGIGIQVGHGPVRSGWEQAWRWHLVTGVDGVQVPGEGAHHREPVTPPLRAAVEGQARPGQRRVGGDRVGAVGVQIADEVGEEQLGAARA